ncbi:hypothetical protein EDD17DRAFT_1510832 [Pisolithus thermaeus]|nr:hypothetical protein EDD17DRAFT_1510832 [Pisolithus thermaeus]
MLSHCPALPCSLHVTTCILTLSHHITLLPGCSCTSLYGDPSSTLYLASACVGMRGSLCQLVLASNCWSGEIWSMSSVPAGVGQQLLVWGDLVHVFCANLCWPATVGLGGFGPFCASLCWPATVGLGGFGPCLPVAPPGQLSGSKLSTSVVLQKSDLRKPRLTVMCQLTNLQRVISASISSNETKLSALVIAHAILNPFKVQCLSPEKDVTQWDIDRLLNPGPMLQTRPSIFNIPNGGTSLTLPLFWMSMVESCFGIYQASFLLKEW